MPHADVHAQVPAALRLLRGLTSLDLHFNCTVEGAHDDEAAASLPPRLRDLHFELYAGVDGNPYLLDFPIRQASPQARAALAGLTQLTQLTLYTHPLHLLPARTGGAWPVYPHLRFEDLMYGYDRNINDDSDIDEYESGDDEGDPAGSDDEEMTRETEALRIKSFAHSVKCMSMVADFLV